MRPHADTPPVRHSLGSPSRRGLFFVATLGVLGGIAALTAVAGTTSGNRGGGNLAIGLRKAQTPPSAPLLPPSPEIRAAVVAQSLEIVRQRREAGETRVNPAEWLQAGKFAALERYFRDLQDRREVGELHESTLYLIWENAFRSANPKYSEAFDSWIAAYPKSGFAWAARGSYWTEVGWEARGGDTASKTSEAQFAGMRDAFAKASRDLQRAIELEPHLLMPYTELIGMTKTGGAGGNAAAAAWLQRALAVDPYNFRVRNVYIYTLTPRWGGSYAAMRHFARESFAHAEENPDLHLLGGVEAADRAYDQRLEKNFSAAIARYGEALAFGPQFSWYLGRARCHEALEQYPEAISDYNEAFPYSLYPAYLWSQRAGAYRKMGDYRAALDDLDRALQSDPKNSLAYKERSRVYLATGDLETARRELDRALELAPDSSDHWWYAGWFHYNKTYDYPSSQRAYRRYTELRPDSANGWFQLSQALDKTEHPDTRPAIVRYLQLVDRGDPVQRERIDFFEKLLASGF